MTAPGTSVSTLTASCTAREPEAAEKSFTYCWACVAVVTSAGGATVAEVRYVVELCEVRSSAITPPTTVITAISQDHRRTRRM